MKDIRLKLLGMCLTSAAFFGSCGGADKSDWRAAACGFSGVLFVILMFAAIAQLTDEANR